MLMTKEVWKDVVGYEGLYKVSNLGNVYSNYVHRNLNGGYTLDGYRYVGLRKNNIRKNNLVHRLVAEAFIPNPDNLPIINHKDENPHNNNVDNLEWCDYLYNLLYNDGHIRRGDKMAKHVYAYDKDGNLIAEYKSSREASRATNLSCGDISACCLNKINAYKDIVWSYSKLTKEDVENRFASYYKSKEFSNNIGSYVKKTKSKKVSQYDLEGNFIQSFPSAQEAGRQLKISASLVSSVCRGEQKATHGYVFKYV